MFNQNKQLNQNNLGTESRPGGRGRVNIGEHQFIMSEVGASCSFNKLLLNINPVKCCGHTKSGVDIGSALMELSLTWEIKQAYKYLQYKVCSEYVT